MALNCGENSALAEIKEQAAALKEKLAGGLDALGDLGGIQDTLNEKLNGLKEALPEIPTSSLQEDLQALSTKFGQELSDAQTALREKWGDIVDDIEDKIASIPSLDQLLSGEFEMPNLCETIENIELQTTVDENGNQVNTVVQKAAPAATPNASAPPVPAFESTVVSASSQPSAVSPSGLSRDQALSAWLNQIYMPASERHRDFFNARTEELNAEGAAVRATDEFKSIISKCRETGFKGGELEEKGMLTDAEIALRARYFVWADGVDAYKEDMTVHENLYINHRRYLIGTVSDDEWDGFLTAAEEMLSSTPGAFESAQEIIALQENRKQLILDYNSYTNKV